MIKVLSLFLGLSILLLHVDDVQAAELSTIFIPGLSSVYTLHFSVIGTPSSYIYVTQNIGLTSIYDPSFYYDIPSDVAYGVVSLQFMFQFDSVSPAFGTPYVLSVSSIKLSGPGVTPFQYCSTVPGRNDGYYNVNAVIELPPGARFFMGNYSLSFDFEAKFNDSNLHNVYYRFFSYSPSDGSYVAWYSDGSDRSVSQQDLVNLGNQITNGYDSSAGDSLASGLQTGVDDYIKQEDELFGRMQYDVPEVSIGSDTEGLLLSASFMQSLYTSSSFVSKCVTFVLSFGLVLFIVGWLKKRD